jgi:nucleotide-binding universal stress UspA family protein
VGQQIVIGYDGSTGGEEALALGVILAEGLEANVSLARVVPKRRLLAGLGRSSEHPRNHVSLAAAERYVRSASPRLEVRSEPIEARTPAHGLRELCEARGASLVVVGSSLRGGPGRMMLGTTSERLCRESPCPVAIAPRGYRQRAAEQLRVIAVAFDAGHEARRALVAAVAVAERASAAIRVFGVVQPVRLHGAAVPPVDIGSPEPRFNRGALEANLEEVIHNLPREIGGQRVVLSGEPVDALIDAGERAADLLVVGSRPKGRLLGLVPDSVSIGIAEAAPWPVLVVPAHARLAPLLKGLETSPLDDRPLAASHSTPPAFSRGHGGRGEAASAERSR